MNNKGFAISGILYTILIIFVVSIAMMLFNLQNRKTILDELKIDAASAVESDNNYEYLLNEINALKTQIGSTDISSIGDGSITGAVSVLGYQKSGAITRNISSGSVANNGVTRTGFVANVFFNHYGITNTTVTSQTSIATIPEGFRPATTVYLMGACYYDNSWIPIVYTIQTDGNIYQSYTNSFTPSQFVIAGSYSVFP